MDDKVIDLLILLIRECGVPSGGAAICFFCADKIGNVSHNEYCIISQAITLLTDSGIEKSRWMK